MGKKGWLLAALLLILWSGLTLAQNTPAPVETQNSATERAAESQPPENPASVATEATDKPARGSDNTLLIIVLIGVALVGVAVLLLLLNYMKRITNMSSANTVPVQPVVAPSPSAPTNHTTPDKSAPPQKVALPESADMMIQALMKSLEATTEQMKAQEQLASAKLRGIQDAERIAREAVQKIEDAESLKELPAIKQNLEDTINKLAVVLKDAEGYRMRAADVSEKLVSMENDARRMLRDAKLKDQLTELDQMRNDFRQTLADGQKIVQSFAKKDAQASEFFEKLNVLRKEVDAFAASFDLPARSAELVRLESEMKRLQVSASKNSETINQSAAEARELVSEMNEISERMKSMNKKSGVSRPETASEEKHETASSGKMESADENWVKNGDDACARGDFRNALIAYNKALESNKNVAGTWDKKSYVLRKLGRLEEAMSACEQTLELYPTFPQALFNRACIFALMKRKDEMLMYLEHACQLSPALKKTAKSEADLRNFANDQEFLRLLQ